MLLNKESVLETCACLLTMVEFVRRKVHFLLSNKPLKKKTDSSYPVTSNINPTVNADSTLFHNLKKGKDDT